MKKVLGILSLVLLAACGKPTSEAELQCKMLQGWQQVRTGPVTRELIESADAVVRVDIDVKTFKNYALVTYNGETARFEKVSQSSTQNEGELMFLAYSGQFPGTVRNARLEVGTNLSEKIVTSYMVVFDDELYSDKDTDDVNQIGYGCSVRNDAGASDAGAVRVPFSGK